MMKVKSDDKKYYGHNMNHRYDDFDEANYIGDSLVEFQLNIDPHSKIGNVETSFGCVLVESQW